MQPAPQSQNEGYHGGSSISFLTNLGPSSDLFNFQLDPLGLMDPLGECPAVEVFKFRDKDGFFGQVGSTPFYLQKQKQKCKKCLGKRLHSVNHDFCNLLPLYIFRLLLMYVML